MSGLEVCPKGELATYVGCVLQLRIKVGSAQISVISVNVDLLPSLPLPLPLSLLLPLSLSLLLPLLLPLSVEHFDVLIGLLLCRHLESSLCFCVFYSFYAVACFIYFFISLGFHAAAALHCIKK